MAAQEKNQAQERFANAFVWATRFVAALLFLSAGMKSWQLATVPSLGDGFLHARWFNIFVVEFELAFAIWLLFGMAPRLTRRATMGLFTIFAGVSLYKAFSGEASCGCFGAAPINPWATATLDVAIVGALFGCRKNAELGNQTVDVKKAALIAVLWTAFATPTLYAFCSIKHNDASELGTEFIGVDGRKAILLEPEKWGDGEFPLLPYVEPIEVREQLKNGKWTVVLYRRDCPKCLEAINDLASKGTPRVVCVEVPPYGGADEKVPIGFVYAKLRDDLVWFVQTPKYFVLQKE